MMPDLKIATRKKHENAGIMVVHNRKDLHALFSVSLSLMGFKMYAVQHSYDAMQTFLLRRPDAIFADAHIPGAPALVRQIKAISPGSPRVVLIFEQPCVKIVGMIKPENVDGILIRPFGLVDIRNAIERKGESFSDQHNRLYRYFQRDGI